MKRTSYGNQSCDTRRSTCDLKERLRRIHEKTTCLNKKLHFQVTCECKVSTLNLLCWRYIAIFQAAALPFLIDRQTCIRHLNIVRYARLKIATQGSKWAIFSRGWCQRESRQQSHAINFVWKNWITSMPL